ncbi:hypothetical protein RHMOL_Rhmol06G0148900 [Rhododendron molle]|uniref:Uncharacterized protein n=1 Tax=Rhododendron molle TaxID=49168 RepID=A0ACC0NCM7_RHOML|nr:hypothetical protein RHMOL_Rhmol06G0148900 [Rhododendron molle]
MLKKGFLGPTPSSNCKIAMREKGKNIAVSCPGEEGFRVSPPDPLKDMSQFLDPLSIELIKSSLGEPSYFDSQDFQRCFKQLIDDCKDDFDPLEHLELLKHHASNLSEGWEKHAQNFSSRVVMVEGESSRLFEKNDVPSPKVDIETYEMIKKPVDELVEMAGQNIPRREENEENSDCYKPTVISGKQSSHKWLRMDFSDSNLKKPSKRRKKVLMGRNYLFIGRGFSQSQVVGKKFCFFHHPSLSDVELRKIEFPQEDLQMDIHEKQLHTKERASDFNLDCRSKKTLVDGLTNGITSDDPIIEEDKSPLQSHVFSFSSQGVSLGKLGSSPPRIVSFKVGGSKRIKAPRSYCEDMEISQSFDNTKRKREHVIEDSYNNPYLFQAARRRYLDCGHSDYIRSGLFFYFGPRSTSGGACFFD